jgi:hypothetical protein
MKGFLHLVLNGAVVFCVVLGFLIGLERMTKVFDCLLEFGKREWQQRDGTLDYLGVWPEDRP